MDTLRALAGWAGAAFDQAGVGLLGIPLAFLLGLLSAVVSLCCTLPVLGVIVGYAGLDESRDRRARRLLAGGFLLGAAVALVILGAVAACIGQAAQNTLGRYWKLFAGIVAIVMGLGAMNLLPFRLPHRERRLGDTWDKGILGSILFGLVAGGAVSVCSLACNPGIYIVLGAAVLQGATLFMAAILLAYALGFAVPLTALMLGVSSLGAVALKIRGAESVIRWVAGVLLIAVGFYFLWTF